MGGNEGVNNSVKHEYHPTQESRFTQGGTKSKRINHIELDLKCSKFANFYNVFM